MRTISAMPCTFNHRSAEAVASAAEAMAPVLKALGTKTRENLAAAFDAAIAGVAIVRFPKRVKPNA
jgi:hypothetical protein